MLKIVTDGAADMPLEWLDRYQIHVIPLHVNFGEEGYTQGPGFTNADFYRLVQERKVIPKTSLPSIGEIKAFYRSVAQRGDTILSIHISSKLSGTLATIESAARELTGEFQIHVFDSLAGSAAQSFLAREARLMEQAGSSLPQIIRRLERIREHIQIIFTLNTLDYAFLSGRVNVVQSLIATALKVKPIIVLRDGLLEMTDKVRLRKRSLDLVCSMLQNRISGHKMNLAVVHAADPQTAQDLYTTIRNDMYVGESIIVDLSIPVAAHLGPGAIGVVAYPVEEEE